MNQWHYAIQNQTFGPVPQEELIRLIQQGRLTPRDLVWNPSFGSQWVEAGSRPELFPPRAPSPPAPFLPATSPAPAPAFSSAGAVENHEITRRARVSLQGYWGLAVATTLVFLLLSQLASSLLPPVGLIVSLIVSGPLSLGMSMFFLTLVRRGRPEVSQLFDGFQFFGNALAAYLLMGIFTFLWALLLIVPGIIAALSYAMTYFILVDQPHLSATDAITRSKQMMRGHKWRYFCLGFRFFGWALLCVFFTFGIGFLWLFPYMSTSFTHFYETVRDDPSPGTGGG